MTEPQISLRQILASLPLERLRRRPPVVGVLRMVGVVGSLGPVRRGLTLAALAGAIERVFTLSRLSAVALAVNSPGGSAVQSAMIADRIRALADEKGVPVFAFAEDVAASGGYWIACAADEIFAHESSIVGSIGVMTGGFGFPELLRKLGIERRAYTVGSRKDMLDPFLPEKPEDVERLRRIQDDIHRSFTDHVRRRRGSRLKGAETDLFSGEFWTGRRAMELGLVDGLGDLRTVMRDRFGKNVALRVVAAARPWWRRRPGWVETDEPPVGWAAGLIAAVEERAWWSRFGL